MSTPGGNQVGASQTSGGAARDAAAHSAMARERDLPGLLRHVEPLAPSGGWRTT